MLKVPLQVVLNENRRYPVTVRSEKKNKNRNRKCVQSLALNAVSCT